MKLHIKQILVIASCSVLFACNQQSSDSADKSSEQLKQSEKLSQMTSHDSQDPASRLQQILDAQPKEAQARYSARHPLETLTFFGIEPGMTVVEALPGGGWYSKILLSYLGADGHLIGADYAIEMYPKFGFFDDKFLEAKKTWVTDWTNGAESWHDEDSATVAAFHFGSMPESMKGSADAVLFIRALHNLARFEGDGGYLTTAMNDAYKALKPGGIVGIVQHTAPESSSDIWASGKNGYLKESFVKRVLKEVGFEFVGSNDINLNLKDQPSETDMVWRLPPSLATSRDNDELKAQMMAIGESSRMTLLFRKPNQ